MSNLSSGPSFPPRSSSIATTNKTLDQANAMPTPPHPNVPEKQNIPRRIFNKILAATSGSSRENNVMTQDIGGASYSDLPKEPHLPTGGEAPAPPGYFHDTNRYGRPNNSSPSFLSEAETKAGINSSRPLQQRHSSFVPLTRLSGREEEIRSPQTSPTSCERVAQSSDSQDLLPLHFTARSSHSSLVVKESRENSVSTTRQSCGYINATDLSDVHQSEKVAGCRGLEPGAKQVLLRPDTGTSLVSQTSYQSEASEAGSTSRSGLMAWSSNLKKWGFGRGKGRERDSLKENQDNSAGRKISWRKSTAEMLSAYTGAERRTEERDGLFWKKNRWMETRSPQQSPISEMSLAGSCSYESLNTPLQNVSAASSQLHTANARPEIGNPQPSTSPTARLGRSMLPLPEPLTCNLDLGSMLLAGNTEGTGSIMRLSSSPSSVSSISSHSTTLKKAFTPISNPPLRASSLEELSLDLANFGSDAESDTDDDYEEDDDATITLKTHQNSLKMSRTGSPKTRGRSPQIGNSRMVSSLSGNDIYSIFYNGTISLGYGTFIKLFQITVTGLQTGGQKESDGRKCFHSILSFLPLSQMIQLARTSKNLYAAVMNAMFDRIHFKPGVNPLSKLPSIILGTNYSGGRLSINALPYNPKKETCHADIEPERFQQRNNIHILVVQLNCLGKMLSRRASKTFTKWQTQDTVAGNGSFVRSLVFDANWAMDGVNWKIVIPVVEKLLRNGGIICLESFKWDIEIPITSDLMEVLATQEGTLRKLSLNGFHQQINVHGVPSRILPGPLKGFSGLVVLELQRLGFSGGERWDRDRQYMKEVFGVIVRSPGIKVLRLGAGVDTEVPFPASHVVMDEQDTESTSDGIQAKSKRSDTMKEDHGLQSWVDLPVFDYDIFEEVYGMVHGDSSRESTTRYDTTRFSMHLSPFKQAYSAPSLSVKPRLGLKELSLDGFIVDQRLLNSDKLKPGCLETLKLTRCCYLASSEGYYNMQNGFTTHCLLGRDLRISLKVIKLDEGFLCSAGKAGAKKIVKELFAGLPPHPIQFQSSPEGYLCRQNTIHGKHGNLGCTRELYILPSVYKGNQSEILRKGSIKRMVLNSMTEPMHMGLGTGGSYSALTGGSQRQYDCENPIKVLALSAGWVLRKEDLRNLVTSVTGLGLKELALDIGHDTWNDFLGLLPNLKNLTAVYLYRPFARSICQQSAESSSTPLTVVTGAGRAKLITLKPRQKFLDQRLPQSQPPHTFNGLREVLKRIPEPEHNRHVIPSSTTRGVIRRRYPADDASAILCSVLNNMYRASENRSDSVERQAKSHPGALVLGERKRFRHTDLAWIGVGRSVWKIAKLEPVYRPSKLEKEIREAKLREDGITEVQLPIQVGNDEAAFSDRWGLKRCSMEDAENCGVKIFKLGRQDRDEEGL